MHLRRRCLTTASDPIVHLLHGTTLGRRGTAPDLRYFSRLYDVSVLSAHNPIAWYIVTASRVAQALPPTAPNKAARPARAHGPPDSCGPMKRPRFEPHRSESRRMCN